MILTDQELSTLRQHGDRASLAEWWVDDLPSDHPRKRVEYLLGMISQEVWAAGWLYGLDERVWDLLHDERERRRVARQTYPGCTGREVAGWLDELERLTLDEGWWPKYDKSDPRLGRVVPADDARPDAELSCIRECER